MNRTTRTYHAPHHAPAQPHHRTHDHDARRDRQAVRRAWLWIVGMPALAVLALVESIAPSGPLLVLAVVTGGVGLWLL